MTRLDTWKTAGAVLLLSAAMVTAAPAQTFNTLVDFPDTPGGDSPWGSLVQGEDGNFYGTTANGGANGDGMVFKISSGGTVTTLHSFTYGDGSFPFGGLALDVDGSFYGTTKEGGFSEFCVSGCGTIFGITQAGVLTVLHRFCSTSANCTDGALPIGALIRGNDGNLYGTTHLGGAYLSGAVFRIGPKGTLTTLYSFGSRSGDGGEPNAGLVQADDGNFYGTTGSGGANRMGGTVFRMTPGGKLSTIYSFCGASACEDGSAPFGALIQGRDGTLYGTTLLGGSSSPCGDIEPGCGTVFRITKDGILTTLHRFSGADGAYPSGQLVQATDGNFYGGTSEGGSSLCGGSGCGTVFEITPDGSLTILHTFDGADGTSVSGLTQATSGVFLGTTEGGGIGPGFGTVFSLSTGLAPFVSFVYGAGKVGQTGGILGQGFTGTTRVLLNGTPASFTVISDTFIKATVPARATTGYVTVMTPGGTLTSNVPFHVLP